MSGCHGCGHSAELHHHPRLRPCVLCECSGYWQLVPSIRLCGRGTSTARAVVDGHLIRVASVDATDQEVHIYRVHRPVRRITDWTITTLDGRRFTVLAAQVVHSIRHVGGVGLMRWNIDTAISPLPNT